MKTTTAIVLALLVATPANAQQVYVNQSTGQIVVLQPTGTVGVGSVGSVGTAFPSTVGIATVGGAGSVGSTFQPFNPGVAIIGEGQ